MNLVAASRKGRKHIHGLEDIGGFVGKPKFFGVNNLHIAFHCIGVYFSSLRPDRVAALKSILRSKLLPNEALIFIIFFPKNKHPCLTISCNPSNAQPRPLGSPNAPNHYFQSLAAHILLTHMLQRLHCESGSGLARQ